MPEQSSQATWFIIAIGIIVVVVIIAAIFNAKRDKGPKADEIVDIPISENYSKGNDSAKVTLVEFSDFQCPACRTQAPTLQQLLEDFPDDVRLVYKHFPLSGPHKNANNAALAAEAAGAQDRFYQFHDALFANQQEWSDMDETALKEKFKEYAETIGVQDIEMFQKDLDERTYQEKVSRDRTDGDTIGIDSTPTVFMNGQEVKARAYESMKADIQKILDSTE